MCAKALQCRLVCLTQPSKVCCCTPDLCQVPWCRGPLLCLEIFHILSCAARTNCSQCFYRDVLPFQHSGDSCDLNTCETAGFWEKETVHLWAEHQWLGCHKHVASTCSASCLSMHWVFRGRNQESRMPLSGCAVKLALHNSLKAFDL